MTVSGVVFALASTTSCSTRAASARGSAAPRRGPPASLGWAPSSRASAAARRSGWRSARGSSASSSGPSSARSPTRSGGGRRSRSSRRSASCSRCWARTEPAPPARRGAGGSPRLLVRDRSVRRRRVAHVPALAGASAWPRCSCRCAWTSSARAPWRSARRSSSSALVEALVSPLVGRVADRRGAACRSRTGTFVAAAAAVVAAPAPAVRDRRRGRWSCSQRARSARCGRRAAAASRCEPSRLGVDQGWAFALNNLGWAGGVAIGAAAGGGARASSPATGCHTAVRGAARADRACGRALVRLRSARVGRAGATGLPA